MNKIGIIGYGSMGSMLVNRFMVSKVTTADEMIVTSLPVDKGRMLALKKKYPGIEIATDNRELAKKVNKLLICVKPLEVKGVLEEITDCLQPGVHLISIAASVSISNIECLFPGKISRVVPNINLTLGRGISLVCHNKQVEKEDVLYLETLFNAVSTVKTINEEIISAATNLTSTAPGLIAVIFRDFVESGVKFSPFSKEEVEEMVIAIFHRITALSHEKVIDLFDNDAWQHTGWDHTLKGENGKRFLKKYLPPIFDDLFDRTLGKFETIETEVTKQFKNT